MTTRRAFLVGAAAALTVPLVRKFEWFIETQGRPLIEVPCESVETLYVDLSCDGQITLGHSDADPPIITWAEYLERFVAHSELPTSETELQDLCEEYGIDPDYLDCECDSEFWLDMWGRTESPNAEAYHLLSHLDIGPELRGRTGEVGELVFMDGPHPGSNYLGVHVYDDLSISLLQHRLNVLGEKIAVEVIS